MTEPAIEGRLFHEEHAMELAWRATMLTWRKTAVVNSPVFNFMGSPWHLKFTECVNEEDGLAREVILVKGEGGLTQKNRFWDLYLLMESMILVKSYFEPETLDIKCEGLTEPFYELTAERTHNAKSEIYTDVMMRLEIKTCQEETQAEPSIAKLLDWSSSFKSLLDGDRWTDVLLKFTLDGQELKAHRMFLEARSSVFAAMFNHGMIESRTGVVTIEDIRSEVFRTVLGYIYCGTVDDLTIYNVGDVYLAADKYDLSGLQLLCVKFMEKNMDDGNFYRVFALLDSHNDVELENDVSAYFIKHSDNLLKKAKRKCHKGKYLSVLKFAKKCYSEVKMHLDFRASRPINDLVGRKESASICWLIPSFLGLFCKPNAVHNSPAFVFGNAVWRLQVWTYSGTSQNPPRYVGLYIVLENAGEKEVVVDVEMSFGNEKYSRRVKLSEKRPKAGRKRFFRVNDGNVSPEKRSMMVKCSLQFFIAEDKQLFHTKSPFDVLSSNLLDLHLSLKWAQDSDQGDVLFRVEESEFRAHRAVLGSQSEIFAAMFDGDASDSEVPSVFSIPDFRPEVFREMLNYAYSNTADITNNNALELYMAAKKYGLSGLKELCIAYIQNKGLLYSQYCTIESTERCPVCLINNKKISDLEEASLNK